MSLTPVITVEVPAVNESRDLKPDDLMVVDVVKQPMTHVGDVVYDTYNIVRAPRSSGLPEWHNK